MAPLFLFEKAIGYQLPAMGRQKGKSPQLSHT
jgi:hypothetical protein